MRKFILSCLSLLTLLTPNVFSQTTQLNGDHLINGHFLVAKATDHDTKKLVFGPWRDNSHDLTIYRTNPDANSNQLRVQLGNSEKDENKLVIGPYVSHTIAPSMVVTANYKVGIGKLAPQSALDVNGTIQANAFSGTNSNKTAFFQTSHGTLEIGPQNVAHCHFITNSPNFYFNKQIMVNGGILGAYGDVNLSLNTHHLTRMTILRSNGYVGIGTTNPTQLLDVNGAIKTNSLITSSISGTNSYKTLFIQTDHGTLEIGPREASYCHFMTNTPYFYFNKSITVHGGKMSSVWSDLFLETHHLTRMTILRSNGYVGIGTTTPQNLLDVNGTIRAKEVKIETGWADFVFAEDYVLPSLSEVKTYIEENKHLPGLPSEKEVKENGVGVGEMQVKLLQKIEELTLYVIQQQQMIEALQAQLNTQNP